MFGRSRSVVGDREIGFARRRGCSEVDGSKWGGAFEKASKGTGNLFTSLGNLASGIPLVGESFTKMGEKFSEAETKGQKLGTALASVGKFATDCWCGWPSGSGRRFAAFGGELPDGHSQPRSSRQYHYPGGRQNRPGLPEHSRESTFSAQEMEAAFAPVAGQLGVVEGHALSAGESLTVMKAATDLAEGSSTNLTTATSSLASVMQAFGIGATGAANASNVLFNVAVKTGTGVDGVAATFLKLHSTLGAVAPPIGQVGGLIADMANHGETGRKALSAVNTALNGILAPTKAVTKAQDDLGVKFFDSSGKFVGMSNVIGQLAPKLAGMSQEQQLATLRSIGFGTANKALLDTILAGPAAFDAATASVTKAGSAHAAAEKQAKTFHGTMEKLKATAEDLGVKFGQVLIPVLQRVGQVVAQVANWFMQHRAAAMAVAVVVGGALVVAIGAYTVSMISAGVATVAATWPILAVIAAVALVVTGIVLLATHWKQVWGDIRAFMAKWWPEILAIFTGGIGLVVGLIIQHWQQISQITSKLWHDVAGFFTHMWHDVTGAVTRLVNDVTGFFSGPWTKVTQRRVERNRRGRQVLRRPSQEGPGRRRGAPYRHAPVRRKHRSRDHPRHRQHRRRHRQCHHQPPPQKHRRDKASLGGRGGLRDETDNAGSRRIRARGDIAAQQPGPDA